MCEWEKYYLEDSNVHPGIKTLKSHSSGSEKEIVFHIHQRVLRGFTFPEHRSFLPCSCPVESSALYYSLRNYKFSSKFSSEYELQLCAWIFWLLWFSFFIFSPQSKGMIAKFYLCKLCLCLCGYSVMCISTLPPSIVADSSAVEEDCKGQWGIPELKTFSSLSQN